MANRKAPLTTGEIYHIYNRGVDKRLVFTTWWESQRFLECMAAFNQREPVGSLKNAMLHKNNGRTTEGEREPLVEILAYCLNPNHYHLLLRQKLDGGISEFMKRLIGGYTWYFNEHHQREGILFQGKFKESRITTNEHLLHVSVYVNLNNHIHGYSGSTADVIRSSWEEYVGQASPGICTTEEVLGQFSGKEAYRSFALDAMEEMRQNKMTEKEWFHE